MLPRKLSFLQSKWDYLHILNAVFMLSLHGVCQSIHNLHQKELLVMLTLMWKEKLNVVDVYMTGCSLPQDTEKLQESKVKETELSTNRMASASSQDLATNIDTVNSEASEKHVIEADIPWMMSNQNLYINEVAMQLEHQEGGTQELLQCDLEGSDNLFDNLDILDMEFDGAEFATVTC
jgi:hypothetical protein